MPCVSAGKNSKKNIFAIPITAYQAMQLRNVTVGSSAFDILILLLETKDMLKRERNIDLNQLPLGLNFLNSQPDELVRNGGLRQR